MTTPPPEELHRLPSAPELGLLGIENEAERLFGFIKAASSPTATWNCSIEVCHEDRGEWLLPVTEWHRESARLGSLMSQWRNFHAEAFLPSLHTSPEQTVNWLASRVLEEKQRILFLVEDRQLGTVGHIGLWLRDGWRLEIDNVVKSPACSKRGVMSRALTSLAKWCEDNLPVDELFLRVLTTNSHAISFYKSNHFVPNGFRKVSDTSPILRNEISHSAAEPDVKEALWQIMRADLSSFTTPQPGSTILTAGPSIGPYESRLTADAVRSGWNSHHSDYLVEFAEQFSQYVGAEYAIPTDSCTSALHLSLWALGVGPGDEVIVPNITWVATANAVAYVGATPVFADVDPLTWCIDIDSARRLVSSRTKAIIPVHLYGFVADVESVAQLCDEFELFHIQDAAPGIGSMVSGKGVGSFADAACFSFQGAKLLVSGEGGVMTTNSEEIYRKAHKIADVGRRPGTFWIEELGKKMKMSNLTASLALAQLQSVERQIQKKRQIRDWYVESLSHDDRITFQHESSETRSICWMTSIRLCETGIERETFRAELLKLGIDTRPVFDCISAFPYWEEPKSEHAVASQVSRRAINLPSGVRLTRDEVARVSDAVIWVLDSVTK